MQALTVMGDEVYLGEHFTALGGRQDRCFFAAVDASTGVLDPTRIPNAFGGDCALRWVPDPCRSGV